MKTFILRCGREQNSAPAMPVYGRESEVKKLNLLLLSILLCFFVNSHCFASSLYPSIYENIVYKNQFDADILISINDLNPRFDSAKAYKASPSEIIRFKAFLPPGATEISMNIACIGWPSQRCYDGIEIKYWAGTTVAPADCSERASDIWSGKCITKKSTLETTNFDIPSKNSAPSTEAVWIYFEVYIPVTICPFASCEVRNSYRFGSKENLENYYKPWYDSAKWESNGDPPYDTTITPIQPSISLTSSSNSVIEGQDITYTLTLTGGVAPSAGIAVPYTLTGGEHTSCTDTDTNKCPTTNLDGTIGGTITIKSSESKLTLHTVKDNDTDNDSLTINLLPVSGYTIYNSSKTITILDNDLPDKDNPAHIVPGELTILSTDAPYPGGTITISDSNSNDGLEDSGEFVIDYYLVKESDKIIVNMANIGVYGVQLKNSDGTAGRKITNIAANNGSESTDSPGYPLIIPETGFKEKFFDADQQPLIVKIIKLPDQELTDSNFVKCPTKFLLPDLYVDGLEFNQDSLEAVATIGNKGNLVAKNANVAFYVLVNEPEIESILDNKATYIPDSQESFANIFKISNNLIYINSYTFRDNDILTDPESSTQAIATIGITKSSCPACFDESYGTFRILAMVNGSFIIPESNSFNNFAKKDDFTINDVVNWDTDISGASESIPVLAEAPDLSLTEVKLKDDISKFVPGDKVVIQYRITNNGSYFKAAPETYVSLYLSEDSVLDLQKDEKIKDISVDKDIAANTETDNFDIDFIIDSTKSFYKYYIFVVLTSDNKELTTKQLSIDIQKVFTPKPPEEITENFSDTPVYLGDMSTGGNKSQLTLKFPGYSQSVDHYIGILYPNGKLLFVQQNSDQPFTSSVIPYAVNTTEPIFATIFESQQIDKIMYPLIQGTWWIYWLTIPAGQENLGEVFQNNNYELGYYSFTISETNSIE